ncbi:helix-turn-helix domain-containing protein [Actinomyces qiguomingii]|uniref:helix-turn-helix domain-containing protein n=1 Tax=Actinomyces qiguomingii TaxID=2057800 RepID=UPI000CA0720A|nr:helix-turn-helix domain-containing protein [Actinomyces qiguomingii]
MTAPKRAAKQAAYNLTVDNAAALADLSPNTIRNMIARGDLRAVKLGKSVRIPISELTRLGLDVPAYLTTRGEAA